MKDGQGKEAKCKKECPKNQIHFFGCRQGECGCAEDNEQGCKTNENPLFVDFQKILETTEEVLPSCMVMYGPSMMNKILNQIVSGKFSTIDLCGVVADTILDPAYLKWADVSCLEKTRAQICVMQGTHS